MLKLLYSQYPNLAFDAFAANCNATVGAIGCAFFVMFLLSDRPSRRACTGLLTFFVSCVALEFAYPLPAPDPFNFVQFSLGILLFGLAVVTGTVETNEKKKR
jgi:hypothetical protein